MFQFAKFVVLGLVLASIWTIGLCVSAGLHWPLPVFPYGHMVLDGQQFAIAKDFGEGEKGRYGLRITNVSVDGNALETARVEPFDSSTLPILCYTFSDFPNTLESSFWFRTTSGEDDAISVPAPIGGTECLNLAASEKWRGQIQEIGFVEYGAGQLSPPSVAFKPFEIVDASLQGESLSKLPQLIRTGWFGYRPWELVSVSALGVARETLETPRMQPVAALCTIISVLMIAMFFGWWRRRTIKSFVVAAVLVWLALDLRWLNELIAKHQATRILYAGKSWAERERLQPDEDTVAAAEVVRQQAPSIQADHIFIASDSTYDLFRLIYFLLPMNAAPLDHGALNSGSIPPRSVIVTYKSSWNYDDSKRILVNQRTGQRIFCERLAETERVGLYRGT